MQTEKNWPFAAAFFMTMVVAVLSFGAPRASAQEQSDKAAPGRMPLVITPDLDQRLAKFKPIPMAFHAENLSPREQQLVKKLVDACNNLEQIYWRQSDPAGLKLYVSLSSSSRPEDLQLLRFLKINGSRYDLIDELKPFVGTTPAPPGRALFPTDLTVKEIEAYAAKHPDQKDALYSERTLVRRKGNELVMIPYHVAFAAFLKSAATALREAAALTEDAAFGKFLRLRADALLSDDYFPSDMAWLDMKDPKIDIIFAPYETYLDDLLGIKGSYGTAVLIRNEAESKKLEVYEKYVPDLQEALPLAQADLPSKRGHITPMEVMDAPFRTGDLLHGYQAVADNLPNDARVHAQKGSKKIFFKNFMDARVNEVILPIAKRLMREDQAAQASGEGYLATTLMHEISHELGPDYSRTAKGQVDIREAIGASFSGLEEAKADITGLFALKWLTEHHVVTPEKLDEDYISFVAGNFRTIRFGIKEAHGRAEMMEFNYLFEQGAITRDAATGRYAVSLDRMPTAVSALTRELLEQEATGNRARSEAWFTKYAVIPPDLKTSLDSIADIPVDVQPIFSFQETIR